MILFCEDCGQKNRVDRSRGQEGERVRFTCQECGYANAYLVPRPGNEVRMKTDRILDSMRSFPEIIGGFSYHIQKGVLSSRMPAFLKPADIDTLGREFTHAYVQGSSFFPDVHGIQILIGDKYFMARELEPRLFLVIVSQTPYLPPDIIRLLSEETDPYLIFQSEEGSP